MREIILKYISKLKKSMIKDLICILDLIECQNQVLL